MTRADQFKINFRQQFGIEQCAVVELVPPTRLGGDDRVAGKRVDETLWRSVIKKNEHRRPLMARSALNL